MKNANMPAMPNLEAVDVNGDTYQHTQYTGLTKREHFAAMAMQGILANPDALKTLGAENISVASTALNQADALLRELEK